MVELGIALFALPTRLRALATPCGRAGNLHLAIRKGVLNKDLIGLMHKIREDGPFLL